VAFRPIEGADPPSFWTMRMTVGVFRNVVVTVRLPDLRWDDAAEAFEYMPGGPLEVSRRFFPVADDLTADDVAEAIGLQQASTARAVSERVAAQLRNIERTWRHKTGNAEGRRKRGPVDARRVIQMTEQLYRLDRQLSRLLRRFELDGVVGDGRSVASNIALRYRFALDELRSLEGNCRLASQAIRQAIATAEQADRERFEFIAAALASSILVPTLVASIYGANVALPAKDSWRGFIALILFITAFALISVFSISHALPHESVPRMRWLSRRPVRMGASVVAIAALVGGVVAVA
jgi:Mg2+ and Co2+ transporter CorA